MLSQINVNRMNQVTGLVDEGRQAEAAQLCREVVASQPEDVLAWLWLVYTANDPAEIRWSLDNAHRLEPQNPAVVEAVKWFQVQSNAASVPPVVEPFVVQTSRLDRPKLNFTPLSPPMKESSNFLMTQSGGLMLVSLVICLVGIGLSVVTVGLLTGLLPDSSRHPKNSNDWLGWLLAVAFVVVTLLAGLVFVYTLQDLSAAPLRSTGRIKNRQANRHEVKDRYGTVLGVDYNYSLDFLPDGANKYVTLQLTEEQFNVCERSDRAFIIYGRKLGNVRVYQPIA